MEIKKIIYTSVLTLLTLLFVGCSNRSLPRTFLIPSDYEGTLRIIYEEKCGIKPKKENGRDVFEFQKNGFIILTTDIDRRINTDYYLVDNKGNRTKVTEILNFKDRDNKIPVVIAGGAGVSSSVVNSLNSNTTLVTGGVTYMDFNLYNKDTIEIRNSVSSEKLDLLTNTLVNACRSNK